MMDNNEYDLAKESLATLKAEHDNLPFSLRSAVAAGDAMEIVRIKQRQSMIGSELGAAELLLARANINRVRGLLSVAHNRVAAAKTCSKETDAVTSVALRVLDDERSRINQEATAGIVAIHRAEGDVTRLFNELRAAEKSLDDLLSDVA
jgi:hypothetical protein